MICENRNCHKKVAFRQRGKYICKDCLHRSKTYLSIDNINNKMKRRDNIKLEMGINDAI